MQSFGIGNNKSVFDLLVSAYTEKHRHYHTFKHIQACLYYFDKTSHLANKPDEIELAIWFHDAVYKTRSNNNELESAQWADNFLIQNKVAKNIRNNIYQLIMATLHNGRFNTRDQTLLVDIDLAILGSRLEVYSEFEKNVRKEFKWVPGFVFKKRRKEILKGFINQKSIYKNKYFIDRFEEKARSNIKWALTKL